MEVSPARIAEMLAPLADRFNAERAADEAAGVGRQYNRRVTKRDLAMTWLLAGEASTVGELEHTTGIPTHGLNACLNALEGDGWLVRIKTRLGDQFRQQIPVDDNAGALGPGQASTRLVMLTRTAAGPNVPAAAVASGGMRYSLHAVLSVHVTVELGVPVEDPAARRRAADDPDAARPRAAEDDDAARRRAVVEPDGAPARHDAARRRAATETDGAPARREAARGRAATPDDGAPARHETARPRAADSPHTLSKENQSVFSSTPSPRIDRSIDQGAREGGGETSWLVPGQDRPLSRLLCRFTKIPYSDPSSPDLVGLFRKAAPGRVFANFLALVEELGSDSKRGIPNRGALTIHAEGNKGEWSYETTRDSLVALGVNEDDAEDLAWYVCQRVVAAIEQQIARRDEAMRKKCAKRGEAFVPVERRTGWIRSIIRNGDAYQLALEAAQQRHRGRQAAEAEANKRQLLAHRAEVAGKAAREAGRTPDAAAKAEEIRRVVAEAKAKDLVDALAEIKKAGGMLGTLVTKRASELRTKHPDESNTAIVRRVAQSPSLIGAVADALTAAKEPRRG